MSGTMTEEEADSQQDSPEWPRGTRGPNGHKQWTWGGKIHPVPQGWSLPKGNTSMLFNLWVNGNAAMGLLLTDS